ncbi:MAG: hypothetical protein PW788_04125 [Micavibrio sp.]|nr:hypothetical protein [Micavibrio sp.]
MAVERIPPKKSFSARERQDMYERWQQLVQQFDREMRDKGMTDEQREDLLKELTQKSE